MGIVLGIDPDTKTTGWAVMSADDGLLAVGVIRADGAISMMRHAAMALPSILQKWSADLAVVESQQIYSGSKAAHDTIVTLCTVAGGLAGQVLMAQPGCSVLMPLPAAWKGQVPKPIHQARVFTKLGLAHAVGPKYAHPLACTARGASSLRQTDWEHVGDAVGLALWGLGQ